jgi:hypothetical protein
MDIGQYRLLLAQATCLLSTHLLPRKLEVRADVANATSFTTRQMHSCSCCCIEQRKLNCFLEVTFEPATSVPSHCIHSSELLEISASNHSIATSIAER